MVIATALFFLAMVALNEWVFGSWELVRGVNWIFLPAGARLLCTLLFAEAGAIGLLLASWLVCWFYYFPEDHARALTGAIAASLAPYLTYRLAKRWMGLGAWLQQLTAVRLLQLSALYALGNALVHQLGILLIGRGLHWDRMLAMSLGDFFGTLLMLYFAKAALLLMPRRSHPHTLL